MTQQIESVGDTKDLLRPVWDLFESGLGTTLEDEFFVPSVVQTLVYGLFASWLTTDEDPQTFNWQSASYHVEVPLFADVLHAIIRPKLIRRCNLFPRLSAVAAVLRRVDRDQFKDRFEGGAIEYFYEPFLARFDAELRDRLGVWYTPQEVAEYQTGRCDHHLQTDLTIGGGLSDDEVYVLDPATGTGTYLLAVLRSIYDRHMTNGESSTVAAHKTKQAALKRVIGFEILPAAFIVAHLNVALWLAERGAPLEADERLRIYLTNSLTGWDDEYDPPSMVLFPELEEELEKARQVKQHDPIIVILGNPPYKGLSRAAPGGEEADLIAPWIKPLWQKWGIRKTRLDDLYIRFWKASVDRIEKTGVGVVSFITNRMWLAGRSYPEMREDILHRFDIVTVDDLHGSYHNLKAGGDESIFKTSIADGIRTGTAIATAVRTSSSTETAEVSLADHYGTANAKRSALTAAKSGEHGGQTTSVSKKSRWRITSDSGEDLPELHEYFAPMSADGESYFSGVQPVRDEAVLAFDRDTLINRMTEYYDTDVEWEDLVANHPGFDADRAGYDGPRVHTNLQGSRTFETSRIRRFLFRPLDARWLYWETADKLLNRARPEQYPFWQPEDQTCLVAPQTRRKPGAARPLVATQVPGNESVDPNARYFLRYRPDDTTLIGAEPGQLGHDLDGDDPGPLPGIDKRWIDAARALGATGTDLEVNDMLFFAIAGIAASPDWLGSQPVEASHQPTIPLPSDLAALHRAADTGRRYAALIDPDVDVPGVTIGPIDPKYTPIAAPSSLSGTPKFKHGSVGYRGGLRDGTTVLWDDEDGWQNIPDDLWEFNLGGWATLPKWLSYRVGRNLTDDDRMEFQQIARRIAALIDLQPSADAVYAKAASAPLTDEA